LIGAGLSVRKAAWDSLVREGFHSWLSGRVGARLSGGEDTELTIALLLNGWKLALEPRLKLKHFMPAHRLDWRYLRRTARGYGASHVALDAYNDVGEAVLNRSRLARTWLWHLLGTTKGLLRSPKMIMALLLVSEGDHNSIAAEDLLGRIIGLARLRGRYKQIEVDVRNAAWRKCRA
jgi:hypothetical protein